MTDTQRVLLIIPCYNEAERLKLADFTRGAQELKAKGLELKFLFADDGSQDNTQGMLENYCQEHGHFYYRAAINQGKANIIQKSYVEKGRNLSTDYHWLGYWDADLATPLDEIPRMMKYLELYQDQPVKAVWASRISRLGSNIKRKMYRHYLGRIFVTIVSNVLDVKAYDSQCGAKLFKPEVCSQIFHDPFISRWIFDVEILLRMKGKMIVEYPLFNWEDVPGSKVKIFREIFRVGFDLLKIKRKYQA